MRKAHWGAALALVAFLLPVQAAEAATPQSQVTTPRPEIGSLSNSGDPKDHHCSGSVVSSPRGNVIVTAAHCVYGKRNVFFSPGYHDGQAPYGTWQSAAIYVDDGYKDNHDINGAGSPYDYAFVVLQPRNGKNVAEVTGSSLNLHVDATLPADMTVFGYPSAKDKPYLCDSSASRDGQYWETLQCLGIPGGFSGGPWVLRGTKELIGVIGGKGQDLPPTDPRNYSVRFDNRVKALYDKAVGAPVPPSNGNLGYPLGSGSTWKHAQLITSGRFTGSTQLDMIVRWSDGEVTLYQGGSTSDPQKPFVGETQLAAPQSIWTHAKGIATVGNGLVVTWSDGEVTYYGSVDKSGFHNEVQLAAPNALWKDHASYIAGLGGDLVVVWNDGETTLYQGIAANKLGSERQLVAPNGTWTHAQTISGGNWTGSGTPDLLVRWSDGEFTIYGDVASAGLGQEHQVQAPNDLWTHATVTAGRGNGIIVRWSDGEVSFYPDVDGQLHREIQLVAP
ncbi:trypsin-like peptidase domain-containing protein [Lentzea sp. NPDC004782]|uniref:trypsin-like serine peptidase n=1 Tax=Lentzea sp. NPDC004782 TaxID=3154458 RepID=UPI00339F590B